MKRSKRLMCLAVGAGVLAGVNYFSYGPVQAAPRVVAALQRAVARTIDIVSGPRPAYAQAVPSAGAQPVAVTTGSPDGIWSGPDPAAAQGATRLSAQAGGAVIARLNKPALDQFLARAPMEDTPAGSGVDVVISLPLPDGNFGRFRVERSPMLAPELAAAFPEIQTYRVIGVDDTTATGRIGWTSLGLHGIVLAAKGSLYLDPSAAGELEHYVSVSKADLPTGPDYVCLLDAPGARTPSDGNRLPLSDGGTRRTYRLALAATAEYTAAAAPGTKAAALARMVATMNRVNGIYERDLAVRLTLSTGTVADPTALIFTNPATDGYTNADSDCGSVAGCAGVAMQTENQTKIDTVITPANYDIGHVFSTGGGGRAGIGVVCSGSKARGVTGSSNPTGDAFDVDYVAHEMGHQFGANHTFNALTGLCGAPNRSAAHAVEPGSGSTIMAYAGICGAENVQSNSNDYFSVESLNEITSYLLAGGAACPVTAATGNTPPTVSAGTSRTIPNQTPFTLTATGSDANGDALTYAWEQWDANGGATSSAADIATDDGSRPLFRSYNPTTDASRTFPSLPFILKHANVPPQTFSGASLVTPVVCSGTCATGEKLPSTSRTMKFQVTARDNRAGGGGIASSQTNITVSAAAGPFRVSAPNTSLKWKGASKQTVTWDVANTTASPIFTSNVKISLSIDGGLTFPTVILASTPNDGTEEITVPNTPTTKARIKVEAVNNIYFDISDTDFEIEGAAVDLAFVVDDTGSMGEEIDAVRQALTNTIARLAAVTGKPFPTTAIITFKDDVTTRIVSNDPAQLQPIVNSLFASGGSDCPEASNAALIVAGNLLSRDGTAMLFTDADSRPDGPGRPEVLNVFLPKALRLSVLLSGACDGSLRSSTTAGGSLPYSDNRDPNGRRVVSASTGATVTAAGGSVLGNETSVRTFSELAAETRGTFAAIPEVNESADGVTRYTNIATNLSVSAVLPTLTLITPPVLPQGVALTVEVTGANTNFQGSSTVTVSGTGVSVLSRTIVSSTRMLVALSVSGTAPTGFRDMTVVTNLGGGTVETATGIGALQVVAPTTAPTIVGVLPSQVAQGSTTSLAVTSINTHFVNGTTTVAFVPATGLTVNSVTVTSATTLTVNVTVGGTATVGFRDVTATTGSETATEDVAGPLLITAPPPIIPRVVSASPASGERGKQVSVTLTGENTHFGATSSVSFNDAGITVNSVTVSSPTSLVAVITLAADTALGFKDIAVTTGTEVAVMLGGFNVVTLRTVPFNFDADGKSDLAIFRPSTGTWYIDKSGSGFTTNAAYQFGLPGDAAVSADYDGDGVNDVAVFRPASGAWFILRSSTNFTTSTQIQWGLPGDIPAPGDYDGDGKADPAVFRPSNGVWYVARSSTNFTTSFAVGLGLSTDIPVPADYDNDGKTDVAVFRPSTGVWYVRQSSNGLGVSFQWGLNGDVPVPGDYDGDSRVDFAVFRRATGTWYIQKSTSGFTSFMTFAWGLNSDTVVPADYDGDGRTDVAVFRPANGNWYILQSTTNFATPLTIQWGLAGDVPAPNAPIAGAMAAAAGKPTLSTLANLARGSDVDGDGRSDITIFRPSNGTWFNLQSGASFGAAATVQWGLNGDIPAPGDFDGDGKTDLTVFRPSSGTWFVLRSSSGFTTSSQTQWGLVGDIPVPGDYDGDGRSDLAIYRPGTGGWYFLKSSTNSSTSSAFQWGLPGDIPAQGDYDGDGVTDIAVYRPSTGAWYVLKSRTGFTTSAAFQWGLPGDISVPGDYDGDGVTDVAVYRPSAGAWYILNSNTNFTTFASFVLGAPGDVPVPGDYDGDGRVELGVFRPSNGAWFLLTSRSNYTAPAAIVWGAPGDIPILRRQ